MRPKKRSVRKLKTIQVGPKTWSECLPLLLIAFENGSTKGKQIAREELGRMARVADLALTRKESV